MSDEEDFLDWDDRDTDTLGDEGCLFPDQCCMPGHHYTSECHTAEMLEAWNQTGSSLDEWMDHLTHDVEAEDWAAECARGIVRTPDGDLSLTVLCFDPCLEDPELSNWRNAFVWRLIEKYEDAARVIFT